MKTIYPTRMSETSMFTNTHTNERTNRCPSASIRSDNSPSSRDDSQTPASSDTQKALELCAQTFRGTKSNRRSIWHQERKIPFNISRLVYRDASSKGQRLVGLSCGHDNFLIRLQDCQQPNGIEMIHVSTTWSGTGPGWIVLRPKPAAGHPSRQEGGTELGARGSVCG